MAAYPRVSMGRPFHEKYADVFWEEDIDGTVLQRWKDGMTGYPIVDAAMRQMKTQGTAPVTIRLFPHSNNFNTYRVYTQPCAHDRGHVPRERLDARLASW